MKNKWILLMALVGFSACENDAAQSDAYGNFEADEVLVSSEGSGKIMDLDLEEGDKIEKNKLVGYVDTIQLHLRKAQLQASIQTLSSKTQDVQSQLNVLKERKANLERELSRFTKLLEAKAATAKQVEDLKGELQVIDQQIQATRTQMNNTNKGILSESDPIGIQIEQIEDQIRKHLIVNPIEGIVLETYAEPHELTSYGKPVYKIANLDQIYLKAYISGAQLHKVRLGQDVKVLIDEGEDQLKTYSGKVSWIASEAEFTPKVIQTRDERVNLVYGIKILVQNDGAIKIGMPGEVNFSPAES
jgi:HlyD family secretion protein